MPKVAGDVLNEAHHISSGTDLGWAITTWQLEHAGKKDPFSLKHVFPIINGKIVGTIQGKIITVVCDLQNKHDSLYLLCNLELILKRLTKPAS